VTKLAFGKAWLQTFHRSFYFGRWVREEIYLGPLAAAPNRIEIRWYPIYGR